MSLASLEGAVKQQNAIQTALAGIPASLWFGAGLFLTLVITGNRELQDSDTYWQIAIGQWIVDHGAILQTDVYSFTRFGAAWRSSSWLAQVVYAMTLSAAGWAGPVMLASFSIATAFGLLVSILSRRLSPQHAVIVGMIAVLLSAHHFLARPHVLALPVMVAWFDGLVSASDRRRPPSLWLLPLVTLWANLHGGFVLGLALIVPVAFDALWNADKPKRLPLTWHWARFAVGALLASAVTPYGWNALLASWRILDLGDAFALIPEWQPANFGELGPFEIVMLAGIAGALWRGISLSPPRILLLLGLLHMALSHNRNFEVLALMAPILLMTPLAEQLRLRRPLAAPFGLSAAAGLIAVVTIAASGYAAFHPYTVAAGQTPAAAVDALGERKSARILHNAGFGGYLITRGIPVFFDGRAELFGERFVVDALHGIALKDVDLLFRILTDYRIDVTMLTPQTPAVRLLDHLDGWRRFYADDVAVVHLRNSVAPTDPVITMRGPLAD
jgi:hypothetical protein